MMLARCVSALVTGQLSIDPWSKMASNLCCDGRPMMRYSSLARSAASNSRRVNTARFSTTVETHE